MQAGSRHHQASNLRFSGGIQALEVLCTYYSLIAEYEVKSG